MPKDDWGKARRHDIAIRAESLIREGKAVKSEPKPKHKRPRRRHRARIRNRTSTGIFGLVGRSPDEPPWYDLLGLPTTANPPVNQG